MGNLLMSRLNSTSSIPKRAQRCQENINTVQIKKQKRNEQNKKIWYENQYRRSTGAKSLNP
jgi:hypothetical protein